MGQRAVLPEMRAVSIETDLVLKTSSVYIYIYTRSSCTRLPPDMRQHCVVMGYLVPLPQA